MAISTRVRQDPTIHPVYSRAWASPADSARRLYRAVRGAVLTLAGVGSTIGCASRSVAVREPSKSHVNREAMLSGMRQTVRTLSVDLFPRDHSRPDHLDAAALHILERLRGTTARVREQPFEAGGERYRNIIATFGPETGERIVIGAHYDAVESTPGADDNASGVAGLLELAVLLSHESLPMRVECVAYTLEEPPYFGTKLMGSAQHAASLKDERVDVRAMIALEMIGYFDDRPGSQSYPAPGMQVLYGSRGDFISVVGRMDQAGLVRRVTHAMRETTALRVEMIAAPSFMPGVDLSDHRNYWEAGFPAVMITDTAFFRNDAYHLPSDTMDRLDFERMADVVIAVKAAVLDLAGRS